MVRVDDSTLTEAEFKVVRASASTLLRDAGALGCFPTPVDTIVDAAGLEVVTEASLDRGFLASIYKGAKESVLTVVDKVLGLFDARARDIYVDQTVHRNKLPFLKLHETGHGYLPHQRDMYEFLEDSKHTLDPETRQTFEREANVFASEVLFQGGAFEIEAEALDLRIKTPTELAEKYGSSAYSAIRRFVRTHRLPCALFVLDKSEGGRFARRRFEESKPFRQQFRGVKWPSYFTRADAIGGAVPRQLFRPSFSAPRECVFQDANGVARSCIVEAFTNTYQVFVLVVPA